MRRSRKPKHEKLILDGDVDPRVGFYLRAVGFSVVFATKLKKVNIQNDTAIVRWGRVHDRIVVCHDKYKDRNTKIKICQEIYDNGGRVIQISRGSKTAPDPLTSLGKVLAQRDNWLEFFQENDGIVLVHERGWKPMPREYLLRQIQRLLPDREMLPMISPKAPRRRRRTPKTPRFGPSAQPPLLPEQ